MSTHFTYSSAPLSTFYSVREEVPQPAAPAPEAQISAATIQQQIDAAIAGLKEKNSELLGKLKKADEKVKQYDGINIDEIRAIKERLDQDEDAKLLAEGKKNVVIEKYTERMRAAHEEALKAERERTAAEARRADAYKGSVLDNQIRSVTGGLHKGAVEDALLHARQIFSLDAKGNAIQLDPEGRPVLGKDGASPFSPAEWIELQRELKPHWFAVSTSGSGSSASRDASGTGKTIKRSEFDRMTPIEQSTIARNNVKIID